MLLLSHIGLGNNFLRASMIKLVLSSPGLDNMNNEFADLFAPCQCIKDLFVLFETPYAVQQYMAAT